MCDSMRQGETLGMFWKETNIEKERGFGTVKIEFGENFVSHSMSN